jgi:hypothetical protein
MVRDFVRLASVIGGMLIAIWLLWSLNDEGYFYHDKLTTVHAPSWVNGEYKECTTLDVKEADEHPELSCETTGGEGKVFNVRFYGRTFAPERKQIISNWRCRKTDGEETTVTCRMVKQAPK